MYYIIALILILSGVALAIYGQRKFNVSLALSFLVPNAAILYFISTIFPADFYKYGYFAILAISILILLFAKVFTYVYTFFTINTIVALLWATIYAAFDIQPQRFEGIVIIAIGIVTTILLRKKIKALVIGMASGYMIGLGVASIGLKNIIEMGWEYVFDAIYYPTLSIFILTVTGIAYQFYLLKTQSEGAVMTRKQVNTYFGGGLAVLIAVFSTLPLFNSGPSELSNRLEEWSNASDTLSSDLEKMDNARASLAKELEKLPTPTNLSEDCGEFLVGYRKYVEDYIDIMASIENDPMDFDLIQKATQLQLEAQKWATKASGCSGDPMFVTEYAKLQLEMADAISQDSDAEANEEQQDLAQILTGKWGGAFGDKEITLDLNAYPDGKISGVNTLDGSTRPLSGIFKGDKVSMEVELKEPGDEKWDGIFTIEVMQIDRYNYSMVGVWKSNNGQLEREFELFRI